VAGLTRAEPVTLLHRHEDTALADVTVAAGAVLHTTPQHRFWDATTRRWVDAADLPTGDRLWGRAAASPVPVAAVHAYTGDQRMYNLTVAQLHTYYVLAGDTPVLVHNEGEEPCLPGVGDIPRKVVNSNMGHIDAERAGRAGFDTVQDAQAAVRDLGTSIKEGGFPKGTIPDTARSDRLLVPIGKNGYAVYQILKNGNAVFKTILTQR
jgi:hypothetical protein